MPVYCSGLAIAPDDCAIFCGRLKCEISVDQMISLYSLVPEFSLQKVEDCNAHLGVSGAMEHHAFSGVEEIMFDDLEVQSNDWGKRNMQFNQMLVDDVGSRLATKAVSMNENSTLSHRIVERAGTHAERSFFNHCAQMMETQSERVQSSAIRSPKTQQRQERLFSYSPMPNMLETETVFSGGTI